MSVSDVCSAPCSAAAAVPEAAAVVCMSEERGSKSVPKKTRTSIKEHAHVYTIYIANTYTDTSTCTYTHTCNYTYTYT